jgi:hypothetical protein
MCRILGADLAGNPSQSRPYNPRGAMMLDSPNFAAWTNENLANFAKDSYDKLREQQEEIEHLKLDLKAAMEAYRALLREK